MRMSYLSGFPNFTVVFVPSAKTSVAKWSILEILILGRPPLVVKLPRKSRRLPIFSCLIIVFRANLFLVGNTTVKCDWNVLWDHRFFFKLY